MAGCASSNKPMKQIPEAQVRSTEQQQQVPAPVNEELALVAIQSKYLLKDTTQAQVFLYVDAFKGKNPISVADFVKLYNLNYVIYSDYGTRERLGYGNVKLDSTNVSRMGDKIVISYDLKSPNRDYGVLLSEISQTGTLKKVLNDLTIRFKKLAVNQTYGVYVGNSSQPLQRHYVNTNEQVTIKKAVGGADQLHVYYYNHDFEPAGSPMNIAPKNVSKSLEVDSTFTINANQPLQFSKEGLYNIFADTTQSEGLGILVVNERFPKITRPQLLLGPLLYMSTNNEINEIKKRRITKRHWINTG